MLNPPSKKPILISSNLRVPNQNNSTCPQQLANMILHHIFWNHCIVLPLELLDQSAKSKTRKGSATVGKSQIKPDPGALKNHTLLCGAPMDALVTATRGDDSILASTSAYRMVCNPFKALKLDKADREDRLSAAILAGTDTRIYQLTEELQLHLTQRGVHQL